MVLEAARTQRATTGAEAPIDAISVRAYRIPTDGPESDGTLEWHDTTLVLAEVTAGGRTGIGYTYATAATAQFIRDVLVDAVVGLDAMDVQRAWANMVVAIRNNGRPGISSMAIAAVDSALWDLKGKLLDMPLVDVLGAVRDCAPVYGSGGFTSYSLEQLQEQLGGWAKSGIRMVKMKVGREPEQDPSRVRAARDAIGPAVELFVDANGAYSRKQALAMAERFAEYGVTWFEEPVSSDDLEGLRLVRDRAPAGIDIAAGEYGYDLPYFERMLAAGAVDVLQADATRCGGITGFLRASALCAARSLPLSAHCAPSLHAHVCCSVAPLRHVEYFHDHVRIEHMLFDGAATAVDGVLRPDGARPGLGLELKRADADRYAI
jgi:L-alanine-DL-glutamate epimerase-like enolase superfamily enzyme